MSDGQIEIDVILQQAQAKAQARALGKDLGAQISASVDDAAKSASKSTSQAMNEIGGSLTSFGNSYSKAVTLPIAAAAVASGAAAVKIDTALTGVRKTLDATEEEYQALKDAAIEFSQTNAVDPAQILDIQALGAQLGYGAENLQLFGETISGLSIATDLGAEEAATAIAQMSTVMNSSKDDVDRYGAAIVDLGNHYATTESSITNMAMRIAGAGKQIGLSEADVLGLATALSSMGIEAEAGGTAISTIMSQIDKDVALGTDSLQTWADTANMSVDEFAAAWGENAVDALSKVLVGMDEATQSGGNMAVMLDELGITSIRQTDTLKRLASNSKFLGEAVETANHAWEENTALDKEVENRNASMAAQLQILFNKVQAVAIEIGEPLVGALLDIIDAAEPFIQALASGAKAFGDLDEGAQKAVLMAVAVVAAFGPMVSITGKVITAVTNGADKWKAFGENLNVVRNSLKASTAATNAQAAAMSKYRTIMVNGQQVAVKFNAETRKATTLNTAFTSTTKAQTAAMKASEVATKAQANAMRFASTAAKGLSMAMKTIAPIAALTIGIELFTALSSAIEGSREQQERYNKATKGLRDSMGSYRSAFDNATVGATNYANSLGDVAKKADEALQHQADLADSLSETWANVGMNNSLVDQYASTIERLADKSNLTAQEQAELQVAVDGLNSIMGTSYSIIDAENGKLSENTDAILASAKAWQQRALAEAASEATADLMKQHLENAQALKAADEALAAAQEKYNEALAAGATDMTPWNDAVIDAQAEVDRLREADKAVTDQMQSMQDTVAELSNTYASSTDALTAYISATGEWGDALSQAGIDGEAFAEALSQVGISTQDLSNIMATEGTDGINGFVAAYQSGTKNLIKWAGEHGIDIPHSFAESMAAGEGDVEAAAQDDADAAKRPLENLDGKDDASRYVKSYVVPLANGAGEVEAAAKKDANAAKTGMTSQTGNAGTWGSHLVQNFASGISGAIDWVVNAANSVASAAASILGFSVPEKGPWSGAEKGGERSGRHMVENIARGMRDATPELVDAAEDAADAMMEPFIDLQAALGGMTFNPNAQVQASIGRGASTAALMAQNNVSTSSTTWNINQPIATPQELQRQARINELYSLAGGR